MTKIRVSVILPCYNHSRYLPERFRSILQQTRPVDEIIFLDDASTDDSLCLARRLLDKVHCPVIMEPNIANSGSTFVQWNKGVNLASGDLIWLAETDDSCDPCLLQTLLDCYHRNRAALAWSQSMLIDEAGLKLHSCRDWHKHLFPGLFDQDFVMDGNHFVRNYLSCTNLIPNASSVLFSRAKYIEAGPANELMRYAGDWLQWIKLIQGDRVCFVSQELNYFRCHSTTTRSNPNLRDLNSEKLVCMATALALTTPSRLNSCHAVSDLQIKSVTIQAKLNDKPFIYNFLDIIASRDILFLNNRIRKKGGLAFFTTQSLFLLWWLSLIHFSKNRFTLFRSRLLIFKFIFIR